MVTEDEDERVQPCRMSRGLRKQQIADIAGDLFSQKGFSGTTTKEIADRAGVSEAIIFRHFSTKRDLYTAILDRLTRQEAEAVQAHMEEAASRKDDTAFFMIFAHEWLEFHRTNPKVMRLLLFSALEGHELSAIFFASTGQQARNLVRGYIKQRVADGVFKDIDPVLAQRMLGGMIWNQAQVELLYQSLGDPPLPSEEIAQQFVEVFLKGISRSDVPSAPKD